ncbi:MAG: nucleotidyltransferase family protein [Bacteroidota bacterium]
MNRESIISKLKSHKRDLSDRYPIRSLGLFGSFAREEATPNSDIDILVDFSEPVGMEVVDLALELEDILQHRVDLITYNAAKQRLLDFISEDLIHV